MAGFMAGFGSGFSEAFSTGYKIEKANQANTFEKMMESFESNKQYVEKAKANDQKAVAQTKNIMEANGLPPQAFMEVYKRVKQDPQSTEEWAKKVKVTPMGEVKPAEPLPGNTSADTQAVAQAAQPPVEQQTQDAFAPQPSPIGGEFGEFVNKGNKNVYDGQIERMMQVTGRSREDVIAILNNSVEMPLEPEVQQAQAQYGDNPQLNIEQRPMEPQMGDLTQSKLFDQKFDIEKKLGVERQKVLSGQTNLKTLALSTAQNAQLVKDVPGVTTTLVSGTARTVANIQQELGAMFSVLNSGNKAPIQQNMVDSLGQKIANTEKELQEGISSGVLDEVTRLAKASELFEMRKTMDGYRVLAMFKQEGRDVSSAEYQRFIQLMAPGTNPETYLAGMKELLSTLAMQSDESQSEIVGEAQSYNDFIKSIGAPSNLAVNPGMQPFAESIKGTPYEEAWNSIVGFVPKDEAQTGAAAGNAGTAQVEPKIVKTFIDPDTGQTVYEAEDGQLFTK